MPAELDPELLQFFVEEANSYLPPMRQAFAAFQEDNSRRDDCEILHRHAHSIKGSAALLGLPELSHVAFLIEDLLDDVLENKLTWNADCARVCSDALELLTMSVDGLSVPGFDAAKVSEKASALFATLPGRVKHQPTEREQRDTDHFEPEELQDEEFDEADDTVLESNVAFAPTAEELEAILPPQTTGTTQEEVSPELLEVFSLEAEEHLAIINAALPELKNRPDDKEQVQLVRRAAHTLKGAASMVGFRAITKLAHRMEDVLDQLYETTAPVPASLFPLLFRTADTLTDLAAGMPCEPALAALYTDYDSAMSNIAGLNETVSTKPEIDEAEVAAQMAAAAKRSTQYVRVPIERLDELTKLVSELVIARTAFEQRSADYTRMMEELRLSSARLKRCSTKLETEYETRTLAGYNTRSDNATSASSEFDSLEFDRYTDFHLISRELAETTTDVETIGNELTHLYGDLEGFVARKARLTSELQDKIMRVRMVPFGTLAAQLQRAVRTTADSQQKQINLVLDGEQTDLDKTVLEEMAEPLLHLLRNAVDHGMELPKTRKANGKAESGTIRVRAFPEGSQVVISVTDDGRGIDTHAVRAKAIQQELITSAVAETLSDADTYRLLFAPGFSTADGISEISGRGVGLDIVQAKVEKLKGTVAVSSRVGTGTTFTIRLPLTLAVTKALMLNCRNQTFALPLAAVEHILRLDDEPTMLAGKPMLRHDGNLLPLIHLGAVLQLPLTTDEVVQRPPVLIVNTGATKIALIVDKILGGREIVVKGLGSHIRKVRGVNGATLQGDGSVVLILNPAELSLSQRIITSTVADETRRTKNIEPGKRKQLRVMIVDDSPSVRRVLSTLVKANGWLPITAKDGTDALEVIQRETVRPDILLSDVEMPRMDGYELLSTLKSRPDYRGMPVVMITSRSGEKHRRKAKDLGASGYVVKPYQEESLLATIRSLVTKK